MLNAVDVIMNDGNCTVDLSGQEATDLVTFSAVPKVTVSTQLVSDIVDLPSCLNNAYESPGFDVLVERNNDFWSHDIEDNLQQETHIGGNSSGDCSTPVVMDHCTTILEDDMIMGATPTSITGVHGACTANATLIAPASRSIARMVSDNFGDDSLIGDHQNGNLIMNGQMQVSYDISVSQSIPNDNLMNNNIDDYVQQENPFNTISSGGLSTPVKKNVSRDELIAFGGIISDEEKGVRSSGRLRAQPNADATQLERAINMAKKKDDYYAQGTSSNRPKSLLDVSEEHIVRTASVLGVSLGASSIESFKSAQQIKDNELHRNLTILSHCAPKDRNNAELSKCLEIGRAHV